mmetsp:Transcript_70210/g.222601  ORF Transcript_70210/g.222601 Transcript_70210/m.222601 type:complete len:84 (-) Transcript_70210:362-613(-)
MRGVADDEAVMALAESAHLSRVNLAYSVNVKDAAVATLLQAAGSRAGGGQLRCVNLRGCRHVPHAYARAVGDALWKGRPVAAA